jgi:hypothetical protein
LPGLQHLDAARLHGGEELELGKTVFLSHHDFAAGCDAGQQRQVQIAAGLAQLAGVARTDGKPGAGPSSRRGIGRIAHGARTDDGLGQLLGDGLYAGQALRRAQRDLQNPDAAASSALAMGTACSALCSTMTGITGASCMMDKAVI